MKACKVDESQLIEWINGAVGPIRYMGPAITDKVAQAMLAAEKRTGERNHIVIDLDDEMDRSGYGHTTAVRILHNEGAAICSRHGLGIAALATPEFGVIWSPIAERVDSMERVSVNGIRMDGTEQQELMCWIRRMMGEQVPDEVVAPELLDVAVNDETESQPSIGTDSVEPDVEINDVKEEKLNQVETHLRQHPPRDFKKEKKTDIYRGYVGFIEIHVTGSSLSDATTLTIPKQLTELNLNNDDLRDRLSETMRIDLSENVDLGVREVNRRVDAFREIFTRNIKQPLGRIYKKSDWTIMKEKWNEIEFLVEAANEKIERSMEQKIRKSIEAAAASWAETLKKNPETTPPDFDTTLEGILSLFYSQWARKKRATCVKIQLFAKDLTWDTLNDKAVRQAIEKEYPDIEKTGLYKSRPAWTD